MFLKFHSSLLIFFIGYLSFTQTLKTKVTLIDASTNNTISDVILVSNTTVIGYTNNEGEFLIKTEAKIYEKINFTHIAYKSKTINLKSLIENPIVKLELKPTKLEEVLLTASKGISKKEVLKRGVKVFEKNTRKDPYWAKANLKQFTSLNNSLSAFLEIDGDMLLLGENKNEFQHPILVPQQARRTRVDNSHKKKGFNNYGMNSFKGVFISVFRSFELIHPLSKKGNKRYNFRLEEDITIDNKECYVISYYSKENYIDNFHSVSGQIIINKDNFNVIKTICLFRLGKEKNVMKGDIIFSINYKTIEGLTYYKYISYDTNFFNTSNKRESLMRTKGQLSLSNIDIISRSNYNSQLFSNRSLFLNSDVLNSYERDYWKNKPLVCCGFESELKQIFYLSDEHSIFLEGANQTVSPSSKEIMTRLQEQEVLDLLRDINQKKQ